MVLQKPQDAAFYIAQDTHPDVKDIRRDLVVVVEAAIDETVVGQPSRDSCGDSLGDGSLGIVGLVSIGQIDDLLAIEPSLLFGNENWVGYDVVEVGHTHGARIAEKIHLHRYRPTS